MNWIRDNILKIVLGLFAIIVIAVVIVACSMEGGSTKDSSSGYITLENRLQNAAISYVQEHPNILPKTTETIKKIKLDTLISAGKISKIYAVDNDSVACKGYVEIEKINEESKEYRYTPYISCGKYYITKTISDYIISKETNNGEFNRTSDDGLYSYGDEYIFRGEYPNNFLILGERLYRIIKINSNNELQLISANSTYRGYKWDDRYNIEKKYNAGINNFAKSRLYESLKFLYDNNDEEKGEVFFTNLEKKYIVEHNFCVGKRDINDSNIDSGAECTETLPMKVGLVSLYDYSRASIDSNCKGIFDRSCTNYNYFYRLNTEDDNYFLTMTAVANNSSDIFVINYNAIETTHALAVSQLYPVIYINNRVIYKSGSGTFVDPYIVR